MTPVDVAISIYPELLPTATEHAIYTLADGAFLHASSEEKGILSISLLHDDDHHELSPWWSLTCRNIK